MAGALGTIERKSIPPQSGRVETYRGPFATMSILFFMWGFMTVFNDILIPRFKEAFTLTYFQAMLAQFVRFGAYFIGSLINFLISATAGDPIARLGYKNGVEEIGDLSNPNESDPFKSPGANEGMAALAS